MRGLVGIDTIGAEGLAESLRVSDSGLLVSGQHPMLTIDNLRKIAPKEPKLEGAEWSRNTLYAENSVVVTANRQYRAKAQNKNMAPAENPGVWEEWDGFSAWLGSQRDKSISKMLMRFQSEKISSKASKTLLENKYLFETTGRMSDVIRNTGDVVGLEIVCPRYQSVTVQVRKIGLQMRGIGEVKVYLYHSSRMEPLREFSLNRRRDGGMEWFDVGDLYLSYANSDIDAGGAYYLVYNQNELPEGCEAVNKNWDWSKGPLCPSCNKMDYENYTKWSKMVGVMPFKVRPTDGGGMWDAETSVAMPNHSFGFNLQLSVTCDLTNFIIENKMEFADVLAKQMAVDMLMTLFYNPNARVNINIQDTNYNNLYADLNGSEMKNRTGMRYELEQAYKAVDMGTRGLDKICLPCANKGIRVKAI